MEIVVRTDQDRADLALQPADGSTLSDILSATGSTDEPSQIYVDGRSLPATTPIEASGLLNGSVLSFDDLSTKLPSGAAVELRQIAGHGAGASVWLTPGEYQLGEVAKASTANLEPGGISRTRIAIRVSPDTSVTVEARDALVSIDGKLIDQETDWKGGYLRIGARVFEIGNKDPRSADTGARRLSSIAIDGSAAFNRPPRPTPATEAEPLEVPEGGKEVGDARRFPLLAMLAPIPIAVAMALLLGSPRFMLFGLMSPVMAGANWISDRRTRKRELGESSIADYRATKKFVAAAHQRRQQDRDRARTAYPNFGEMAELARGPHRDLWACRPGDPDTFIVPIGLANQPWSPELAKPKDALVTADQIVAESGELVDVPIVVDFNRERGLGLVGKIDFTLRAARGVILQAAVTHGPADLDIVIATSAERAPQWEWAKWLPHSRAGQATKIFTEADGVRAYANSVDDAWEPPSRPTAPGRLTLVVVDEPHHWRDRQAPLRPLLADPTMPVRFVALCDLVEALPALCTTVLHQQGETATVEYLLDRSETAGVAAHLPSVETAEEIARHIAPLDDPELDSASGSSLPEMVSLLSLLDVGEVTGPTFVQRWKQQPPGVNPSVAAGRTETGTLNIDLVADGPHGLIAGTTGAGKSELLRSLVVGLAANHSPDEVNFVLVDFKGGSAFDACARLPHTVGLVTDLDEHLAGRVLRCLKAELHHRELVLREAGAAALTDYQLKDGVSPLPRLVLVVDEFASVAAELPEFLPSLVDIAQRGRSLGLHMILATQRPAGVVDQKIKANTNLRIALRVQDDGDSIDVINTRDAAQLPRQIPGRAYARFGAGELSMFQSAYSTGTTPEQFEAGLDVSPFVVGRPLTRAESRTVLAKPDHDDQAGDQPSDLERLVDSIWSAAAAVDQLDQRRPYPEPLPEQLPLDQLLTADPSLGVPFAIVDLPDQQRQDAVRWEPGPGGSMIIYGISGSGTSSALLTLAAGASQQESPDDLHLYCIDADSNKLSDLESLPHCGAVIRVDELERVVRLAKFLTDEVQRRKRLALRPGGPAAVAASEPKIVVMIDNVGALTQSLETRRDLDGTWAELERAIRDGQPLGICAVLTAKQERHVPASLATQIPDRLVMRLSDSTAYMGFGFRQKEIPQFVPGRALRPSDKTELQLAMAPSELPVPSAFVEPSDGDRLPKRLDPLPERLGISELAGVARRGPNGLLVQVGLDTATAEPAMAQLRFGESVFVAGASGTGRSSVLLALGLGVQELDASIAVFAVNPRPSPLDSLELDADRPASPSEVAEWVERIGSSDQPRLVLVDDADRVGGASFERLAALRDDNLIVVASGRADDLKAAQHWTKPMQRFRNGVLLRPTQQDGELIRTMLGTRLGRFDQHRGVLVNDGEITQVLAAVCCSTDRELVAS